jgi:uracil-DNA glycosylase
MASRWQLFRERWKDCSLCSLCEVRKNVVMCRGSIPCEALFIGEAPGASEDVIGRPFVGPAGKLLDEQIAEALRNSGKHELRLCYTNLVCCIPKEEGKKIGEPPKWAIEACEPRLTEFIALCKPRLIVAVGDLADKCLKGVDETGVVDLYVQIVHPAAVLRAEIVRQALMNQRAVVILENAFAEL